VPQPIATWNPARGVWEVPGTESLICGHSERFSVTWPTSGMTRSGSAFALPMSAPLTAGSACSSLLPTPDVPTGGERIPDDATVIGNTILRADGSKVQVHLSAVAERLLLRTPTAQLAVNGGSQHPDKRKLGGHGPTLADEIEHLLPTPAVNDMGEGKTVEKWDDWTAVQKAKHGNGNGHGPSLAIEALRLLPTPVGADARASRQSTAPNPRAVNDTLSDVVFKGDIRGAPMSPLSDDGSPSSDD